MAALCTGNYGLSQNCTDDSKEYFFVKLTDSAYRAVEEYQRNQNKFNTHATIQIIGNGGVLSFPTVGGNMGQQFSFSIDEIEGSFECIRQTQNQLDVLGALPYKMRIHANDDVYETTRYRMAVAEETQKNKCTREIKPNQTDIGRKVKLKNSISRPANIPPKRDNLVNSSSTVSSSSSSNNLSSSSNLNTNSSSNSLPLSSYLTGSNHISSLSPISSLNGNCNNNNNLNNSSNNISSSNNSTTSSTIGNHHSSSLINSSSAVTTNHHSSGTLKNSSSSSSSNILNNLSHSQHSSSSSSSSKLLSGFTSASGLTPGISSASSLSSALSSAAGSGTSGINNGYFNSNSRTGNSNSGSRRGLSNLTGNSSSNRSQKNISRHMPDITKRKIRERLIHLLALKPFKKPELYSRLQNEGIREKERGLISGILKEIATMRDNTYNLKRQIWNDVNEDWPFYTEQELQMLKRRKPQNLTPPLSSDGGSSTSGQSPTSTHNGSPPPAVKRPSLDRDRFYEEPISKKQRISHFRKETNEISRRTGGITNSRDSNLMNSRSSRENRDNRSSSNYFGSSNKHHHDSEDNAMGLSYAVLGNEAARRISPRDELSSMMMNGHISNNNNNNNNNSSNNSGHYNQNNSHHHSYHHNNHHSTNSSNSLKDNLSYNGVNVRQQSPSLFNSKGNSNNSSNHHSNSNSSSNNNNNNQNNNNGTVVNGDSHSMNPRKSDSPSSPTLGTLSNSISPASPNRPSIGIADSSSGGSVGVGVSVVGSNSGGIMRTNSPMSGLIERGSAINNNSNSINQGSNNSNNINSNGNGNSNIINSNCNMNMNMNNNNSTNNGTIGGPLTNNTYDFSRFTKITSVEQRRLYKTEFESDYDEYRKLLHKIESVGQRFQILAQRLNNARNDDVNYKLIKKQIVSEYEKINREQEHQKAKARFDYLHAKLAHIKALVSDFDEQYKSSLSSASSSQQQQHQSVGGIISDNRINSNGSRILSQLSPSNANNSSANNNVNNNSNCINNGNINYSNNNNNNNSSNNNLLRTSSPLSHNFSSSPSRLSSSGSSVITPSSSTTSSSSNGLLHIKHENY